MWFRISSPAWVQLQYIARTTARASWDGSWVTNRPRQNASCIYASEHMGFEITFRSSAGRWSWIVRGRRACSAGASREDRF